MPSCISEALRNFASLLRETGGCFALPVLQNIVDSLVEQASNPSPSPPARSSLTLPQWRPTSSIVTRSVPSSICLSSLSE